MSLYLRQLLSPNGLQPFLANEFLRIGGRDQLMGGEWSWPFLPASGQALLPGNRSRMKPIAEALAEALEGRLATHTAARLAEPVRLPTFAPDRPPKAAPVPLPDVSLRPGAGEMVMKFARTPAEAAAINDANCLIPPTPRDADGRPVFDEAAPVDDAIAAQRERDYAAFKAASSARVGAGARRKREAAERTAAEAFDLRPEDLPMARAAEAAARKAAGAPAGTEGDNAA